MDFRLVETSADSLKQYCKLFQLCFPSGSHLADAAKATYYLTWLYRDNPEGGVVGFDAWDGYILAAHYSTIPVCWSFCGTLYNGLLSLNTATHPDFRRQGLFTRLAEATYGAASDQNYDFIIGVANQNSTPGFIRKLDFTLVSPLDACIGMGGLPSKTRHHLSISADLIRHHWSNKSFSWRRLNPNNPGRLIGQNKNIRQIEADTGKVFVKAYAEIPLNKSSNTLKRFTINPRLILGMLPKGMSWGRYIPVPEMLRPSAIYGAVCAGRSESRMTNNRAGRRCAWSSRRGWSYGWERRGLRPGGEHRP